MDQGCLVYFTTKPPPFPNWLTLATPRTLLVPHLAMIGRAGQDRRAATRIVIGSGVSLILVHIPGTGRVWVHYMVEWSQQTTIFLRRQPFFGNRAMHAVPMHARFFKRPIVSNLINAGFVHRMRCPAGFGIPSPEYTTTAR